MALAEIGEDAEELAEELVEDTAEDLTRQLRTGTKHGGETPEDTGEYAAGWEDTVEQRGVTPVHVIRNTAKPQLTHLLEYGTREQKPRPHIRTAYEKAIKRLKEK